MPKNPRRTSSCGFQTGITTILTALTDDYHSSFYSSFGFRVRSTSKSPTKKKSRFLKFTRNCFSPLSIQFPSGRCSSTILTITPTTMQTSNSLQPNPLHLSPSIRKQRIAPKAYANYHLIFVIASIRMSIDWFTTNDIHIQIVWPNVGQSLRTIYAVVFRISC